MKKDLIDLICLNKKEIIFILDLADRIKKNPGVYSCLMENETLLMIFEKPSLRTRVSFETGMTQMGGHAIYYDIAVSPMGQKESIADTAKTASRYVDLIMARLFSHEQLSELAENASVPVINALTDFSHPCQILADLMTIRERKNLDCLTLAYVGDCNNNVTNSLLFGCAIMGINITVSCPSEKKYFPQESVLEKAKQLAEKGKSIKIIKNPAEAVKNADVVYTDSWMSYHIPEKDKTKRIRALMPYQITKALMLFAKKDALFMNCLPAARGMEQTAEIIDGPQSVVFDQAENRLHVQKAIMLKLLNKA